MRIFAILFQRNGMNKKILQIALPSIVSNITVPLLGMVDVAIAGHLGDVAYIGAIAVGGMLFNMLYWLFGFLRMGTSGLTAQALGRGEEREVARLLFRSIGIGLLISILLILFQEPLLRMAFYYIRPSIEVNNFAELYFRICIWGAPAVLGLYSFVGWFIGMQNSRYPMIVAIVQNIVNILCSLCFVYGFGMKVEGVALGTLVAQYAGLLIAVGLWLYHHGHMRRYFSRSIWFEKESMSRFFSINKDIFFRTLCLILVTTFFTSAGARQGDVILAVNTLLMQLFTLFSYVMDGFAYAGESMAGLYIGRQDLVSLRHLVRNLFRWGLGLSLLFTTVYAMGGERFLSLLTDASDVIAVTDAYLGWALAIPLTGFSAFLWDGIFIGATASRAMLWSMLSASLLFFVLYYALFPYWANHALWFSFLSYLSVRALVQYLYSRRILLKK